MLNFFVLFIVTSFAVLPLATAKLFNLDFGINKFKINCGIFLISFLIFIILVGRFLYNSHGIDLKEFRVQSSSGELDYRVMFILLAFLTPIIEEVYFRGVIYYLLERFKLNHLIQCFFISALWSIMHTRDNIFGYIFLFSAGILFYYLRRTSQSIWPCIVCHVAVNSFIILLVSYY